MIGRVFGIALLAFAGLLGPLLSLYIWIALWDNDRAQWDSFSVTALSWFVLPAAITAFLGAPLVRRSGINVAVTSATSGAVGWLLTYVTFIAWASAEFGS